MKKNKIEDYKNIFFIGIAGTGMSAIAQYLSGIGKQVSGSDRYFIEGKFNETKHKLEQDGISCFLQNGEGITSHTNLVVVSTAIEDSVFEVQKSKELGIPIIKRSELLAMISESKKTIAVAGTSGKSTTSAMLFDIMEHAGFSPSIISGAGLVSIIKKGKIGNAKVGTGEWLIIEADESDGSIVNYHPEIGLLLNIDKDHQEIDELINIFTVFKNNTKDIFIVNQDNSLAAQLSNDIKNDFSVNEKINVGIVAHSFRQSGLKISFTVDAQQFELNTIGKHNMQNAIAAIAVAVQLNIPLTHCAQGLEKYEGIYRRHQLLGVKNGVYVIDDYAHNPVKCAASIEACQDIAPKVIAWFQPHGYGPTRFLKNDFIAEFSTVLREDDELWMSEIFYAGGTAVKDISSKDLTDEIARLGKKAFFVENRNDLLHEIKPHLTENCVLLLMGARDPGLEQFCHSIWESL
jgi:UDP-N-acetylmuramate--alanine ligase